MKTKILGIVTMVTVLLMMLVSSVNAATMTADKTEMQKDEIVTITVTTEQEVASMQFDITFDSTKYEYVEDSATSDLANTASRVISDGVVRVSAFESGNATNTLTLQFKAIENGENVPFTVSNTEFVAGSDETGETFEVDTINVTIADAEEPTDPENPGDVEDPTDPENPGDVEDPGDVEEPTNPENPGDQGDVETPSTDTPVDTTVDEENGSKTNTESQKVDENGNVITKLPQTGTSIVTVAGVIAAVVVVAAIAVRKLRK